MLFLGPRVNKDVVQVNYAVVLAFFVDFSTLLTSRSSSVNPKCLTDSLGDEESRYLILDLIVLITFNADNIRDLQFDVFIKYILMQSTIRDVCTKEKLAGCVLSQFVELLQPLRSNALIILKIIIGNTQTVVGRQI
jgi:hypothetical protein